MRMELPYLEIEREFYLYMKQHGPTGDNSKSNYISWLRYINHECQKLNTNFSTSEIDDIINKLYINRSERNKYATEKDISNFKSALTKFKSFIDNTDIYSEEFSSKLDEKEIINIQNSNITETEKLSLLKSRIGQGIFRTNIIKSFNSKCLLSKCTKIDLLIASHIKPWRNSNNEERLDGNNGILFLPTYDKLFDKGYISFDDKGKINISQLLNDTEIEQLKIPLNFTYKFNELQLKYIEYHFKNVFIKYKSI